MRRSTILSGLRLIIAAELLVIIAAFYHEHVGALFLLSPAGETRFIFLAFFWGSILGFWGIVMSVIGLLRRPSGGEQGSLSRPLVLIAALALLFLYLFLSSFNNPERPQLRPGETIII
jgi:hypothetical protein